MWRIVMLIIFTLLFSGKVNAESEFDSGNVIQKQANEAGKVILEKSESLDDNSYILNDVEPLKPALIMQSSNTTFSVNDYRDGFFDNPIRTWTGVIPPEAIDNNTSTYTINEFTIKFSHSFKLNSIYMQGVSANCTFSLSGANGISIQWNGVSNIDRVIDSVQCTRKFGDYKLYELELFTDFEIMYIAASDLNVDVTETSANVSFTNPKSQYFVHNNLLLNGKVIAASTTDNTIKLDNLKQDTEYEFTVRSYYTDGVYIDAVKTFRTEKDKKSPDEVMNLTAKQVATTAVLSWKAPTDKDLSHYRIYRDNELLADNVKSTTYTDSTAKLKTVNKYRVVAVDEAGNANAGVEVKLQMDYVEVTNLQAVAMSHEKVELKWRNPESEEFEKVIISRKNNSAGLVAKVKSFFSGDDGYTNLFSTNGTVFTDMTVDSDTQYTYLLKAVFDGTESNGITVKVKTPKVQVGGGGITVDSEKKSYTITWNSPTIGKMKILVGGKDYATVPAADKKIVIPAEDMKFDLIGKPDVKLVPIDENGIPGASTSPGGNSAGGLGDIVGGSVVGQILNAKNLLMTAVALLILVGTFVLLGLAFRVVPKLVRTIRVAFETKRGAS